MAAAISFVCRGRSSSNRNRFGILKQLGQRRHTTTQAAAPTLDVLLHDPIRTVGSWGLPNADCSTKSAILSKNSNVFNEYGDTMRFGVKEPKLLFTGNRDYGLIKNNGQRIFCSTQASSGLGTSPPQGDIYKHLKHPPPTPVHMLALSDPVLDRYELKLTHTRFETLIHYLSFAKTCRSKITRYNNSACKNSVYLEEWTPLVLPYIESHISKMSPDDQMFLDLYWKSLHHLKSDNKQRAEIFLKHCVNFDLPRFHDYFKSTIEAARVMLGEDDRYNIHNLTDGFKPGVSYQCGYLVKQMSAKAGKQISVRFQKTGGRRSILKRSETLLMFDLNMSLVDHPEDTFYNAGINEYDHFIF